MKTKKSNHCICGMCSFYKSGYGCTLEGKHHRIENKKLKATITELKGYLVAIQHKVESALTKLA